MVMFQDAAQRRVLLSVQTGQDEPISVRDLSLDGVMMAVMVMIG